MGFLKGAGIITLAVVILCTLAGIVSTFLAFGASMGFLFIAGLFLMILVGLVIEAMKKLWKSFLGVFARKNAPTWF